MLLTYSSDSILVKSVLVGLLVPAAVWLFVRLITASLDFWEKINPPCNLPVLNLEGWQFAKAKHEYLTDLGKYLQIGRNLYRDTGYQLWSPEGYKIVLPASLYQEITLEHDNVISNGAAIKRQSGGYNLLGPALSNIHIMVNVIRGHLLSGLGSLGNSSSDAIKGAMHEKFPQSEAWQKLHLFPKMLQVIVVGVNTTYYGRELGHDSAVQAGVSKFPIDFVTAAEQLRKRSYLAKMLGVELGLIPEVRKAQAWLEWAHQTLAPTLKARAKAQAIDPAYKKPNDFLQWIYDTNRTSAKPLSLDMLAEQSLLAVTPAVHTTGFSLVNIVYYLAWHQEYVEELRAEVDRVWTGCQGRLDANATSKMDKLDSFMMEAHRHSALRRLHADRSVNAKGGYTFSNGLHLKRGAMFALDAPSMEMDPKLWDRPEQFQPFRFSEIRAQGGDQANKLYFASTNPKNAMHFGHGRHSCPGRSFASLIMKIFLAVILHEYDVKPEEGAAFPKPMESGPVQRARSDVYLLFRKRQ